MRTTIKQKAIHCLGSGFYPQHVVKTFLRKQHKNVGSWVKTFDDVHILARYVCCHDAKFYGYTEKALHSKRAYYRSLDITVKRMENFLLLNKALLLDVYEKATDKQLKSYYKALAILNGVEPKASCFLWERRKMEEIIHNLQSKLINLFIDNAPAIEDLRNFIIISVLFSESDLLHDEITEKNFLTLCTMC